ncbi:MAG TPA: hypothetical protein VF753_14990 [Terriglobales bacterium]
MSKKREIQDLFQPLIGQKAWGGKVGWGSFVTIEFGARHLEDHHFHGDWHLWLYQCDWELRSGERLIAHSESKKRVMQLAIDNLNETLLTDFSYDARRMLSTLTFGRQLRLACKPYPDATPDEECWMLFLPDRQVASLRASGLELGPAHAVSYANQHRKEPDQERPKHERRMSLEQ